MSVSIRRAYPHLIRAGGSYAASRLPANATRSRLSPVPPSHILVFPFSTNNQQWERFFQNVKAGVIDDVENDLKNGFDVNYREPQNMDTPLMIAAAHNQLEVMKLLMKSGAKVNFQDSDGDTALIKASRGNHYNAVKLLLESGAQVNVSNFEDMDAADVTDKERIELLIEQYLPRK